MRRLTPERAVFMVGWLASVAAAFQGVKFIVRDERRRRRRFRPYRR